MRPTHLQIKEKLLKQLEGKNDVDETSVVEMVTILEKYPVTRVTLEETKIGKVVNDLRRKIKNEKLAKRLKQLVRNWRTLLDHTANGIPALSKPQSSPSMSPAICSSSGALALPKSRSDTSKPVTQQSAQLITQGIKPGGLARKRGLSPKSVDQQLSFHGKVASPVLPAGYQRAALTLSSSHMTSPSLSNRLSSEETGRVSSPGVSRQRYSSAVFSRTVSPCFGLKKDQPGPLVTPNRSPALQSVYPESRPVDSEDSVRVSNKYIAKLKGRKAAVSELGRLTPTSLHSENSQDRLSWLDDNGRLESDSEQQGELKAFSKTINLSSDNDSSCSSTRTGQIRIHPQNHSNGTSVSNLKNKHDVSDQRVGSKAKNGKRAHQKSSVTEKTFRSESSSLSANSHTLKKVINGNARKLRKKDEAGFDVPCVASSSFPSVNRSVSSPVLFDALCDSDVVLPQSDAFLQQESSDSRLSASSLDKLSRDKPKVKTTEQLIVELQKRNKGSNVGNNIMTKLRSNLIEKEKDVLASVLPAGVRPRGKRGQHKNDEIHVPVPSSDVMLSQVKNELVERFLKTSDPSSLVDEYNPFKDDLMPSPVQSVLEPQLQLGACSSSFSKDSFDAGFSGSRQDHSESAPKDESSMDAISPITSTFQVERSGSALTLEEIYAQLPPVDSDIDWDGVDFFELPEQAPVTEQLVNHLHNSHLPGINGMYDMQGGWTSWQQTMTLPSYEDNQLHILPYVDLDL